MAFNATPLFDMMFTLTIFFMLVCRLSSAEQVRMELPKPEESRAEVAKMPERVVINCRFLAFDAAGRPGGVAYSLGPNAPEPLHVISGRLAAMKRQSAGLEAVVRADKRLRYADVRAAMRIVAENQIEMLNVVAHVGETE
jgi:biopolymer transport protein ExbD